MIGYSDSTKDGGYLAACWNLQRVQTELHDVAAARGVKLTFFHGRGGSLGRGGGPAARAILSLPTPAFDGSLRLTEQGEILAERYDDPQVAYRHLEQVLWSVLVASSQAAAPIPDAWSERMDRFAESSFAAYRRLVEHPSFGRFFRAVTPIADIEGLQIASRPSRRVASDRIEDLRAIPWVFAWTQCRCLIPAWFGLGTATRRVPANRRPSSHRRVAPHVSRVAVLSGDDRQRRAGRGEVEPAGVPPLRGTGRRRRRAAAKSRR